MNSFGLIAAFAFAVSAAAASKWETEDGVIIGTDDNLNAIIAQHERVLIKFYAPWCGHCKAMAPEFAKAAALAEEDGLGIKFVKVDATVHEAEASRHEIQSYPNLKFYKSGEMQHYEGGRNANHMLEYLKKKCGPPAIPVDTIEAANKAKAENAVAVFGLFESVDAPEASAFKTFAAKTEHMVFISDNADVATEFGVTMPSILVFADFEGGRSEFEGNLEDESLVSNFITGASLPLVIEFSDQVAPKIFGGDQKVHMLMFLKKSAEDFEESLQTLKTVANEFRGQMLFIYIDADTASNMRILEYFQISANTVPAVRIINLEEEMAKFVPETTDVTVEALSKFVSSHLGGESQEHLLSEETPSDWDAKPVKVLTGKNFPTVALDPTKNVFVKFYAPWCGHCKQLVPVFELLGQAFEAHSDVVVAKFDATKNEVAGVTIKSYPTLRLYPATDVSDTVIEFEGDRTLAAMSDWLTKEVGAYTEVPVGDVSAKDEL